MERSCNDQRSKLSQLVTKVGGESVFDTFSPDAVICYGCQQSVRKDVNKEKEIRLLEEELVNLLEKLPQIQSRVQVVSVSRSGKRANDLPDNPRPSKSMKTNESTGKTSESICTYVSEHSNTNSMPHLYARKDSQYLSI